MGLSEQVKGDWTLEPFPPGHYEEYQLLPDGKVQLLKTINYHKPGDKPQFDTFIPSSGNLNIN